MKNRLVNRFLQFLLVKHEVAGKQYQGMPLLVSFMLAGILWFLLTMNQTYTTELSYPIQIIQYPEGYQAGNQTSQYVNLEVEGNGADLLLEQLRRRKDTIYFRFRDEFEKGYFFPQRYISQIERDIPAQFRLVRVVNDSLYCPYEEQMSKKVKLNPRVEILLEPGVALFSRPVIRPDSVTVVGPEKMLDSIQQWDTEPIVTPRLSAYEEFRVRILDTFKSINVSPREATLYINPELYTQTRLRIPIKIIDVPDRTQVRLRKDTLTVNLLVPMDRFEALHDRQPEIQLSFNDLDTNIPFFIPRVEEQLPGYVKLIGRSPIKIPYVIVRDKV